MNALPLIDHVGAMKTAVSSYLINIYHHSCVSVEVSLREALKLMILLHILRDFGGLEGKREKSNHLFFVSFKVICLMFSKINPPVHLTESCRFA